MFFSSSCLKQSETISSSATFQRVWNRLLLTSFKNVVYEYCFAQLKNMFISSINSSLSLNLFRGFSLQIPIMYLAMSLVHSSSGNFSEIILTIFLTIIQFLTFHSLLLISLAFCSLNLFLICLRIALMLDFKATSLRFCLESILVDWLYRIISSLSMHTLKLIF